MGRQPLASARLPSQRATAEVRLEAASRADAERQLKERDAELAQRTNEYSAARARVRQLEKDLKERGQYRRSKSNSQSTHDRYAQEIASMLEDYDISEAASLLAAALVKLEKKHSVDLKQQLLDTKPLAKAMHDRDEKTVGVIAKNIRENIFTPEKFAMLRLVVNNSLRECELGCGIAYRARSLLHFMINPTGDWADCSFRPNDKPGRGAASQKQYRMWQDPGNLFRTPA